MTNSFLMLIRSLFSRIEYSSQIVSSLVQTPIENSLGTQLRPQDGYYYERIERRPKIAASPAISQIVVLGSGVV